MFPKAHDYHKPNKPLVPNGLGVVYVLLSAAYLFSLEYFRDFLPADLIVGNNSFPLTLAACILFGGFMGVLDDWMDLRWRYKAFFPLVAAIPLVSFATQLSLRTSVSLFFFTIDFHQYYYFLVLPLIVTISTNTVNQLGGLNGLETICPAIVIMGLAAMATMRGSWAILLYAPLAVWLLLAFFNLRGKIFVGNSGSFAIGMTLAAFAVMLDLKFAMLIALLPYLFNSALILLTYFFKKTRAQVAFDGQKLYSDHRRSLITLLTYRHPLTERQVVVLISSLVAASTVVSALIYLAFGL